MLENLFSNYKEELLEKVNNLEERVNNKEFDDDIIKQWSKNIEQQFNVKIYNAIDVESWFE